jgi:1-acyl-sn-glycerol-3-phosphate acyltransferase
MDALGDWRVVLAILALALVVFVAALPWLVRPLFRLALAPHYKLQVRGRENLPKSGPALLAVNHVTWIDGFILVAATPLRGRALVSSDYVDFPVLRWLARWVGLISVPVSGPRAQRAVITAVRESLDRGEAIAIFPEGQLTRTGLTGPFYRGLEVMIAGREHVPVIPVYLDNLWGSIFSFKGGKFFTKRPEGLRRTVTVVFGPPVPPPITAFGVRQAVLAAGVRAFEGRTKPAPTLDTIDLSLPHLAHPTLGLLAASTADDQGGVKQIGQKPGTLGLTVPGVALRVVDDAETPLPPGSEGRLQALVPGAADWAETGYRGSLDRDGFVSVVHSRSPEAVHDGPASLHSEPAVE